MDNFCNRRSGSDMHKKTEMTPDEAFVLVAAFRYASGRHTVAMDIVANYIGNQVSRMSPDDIAMFL